jgi:uncharacterized membrane protein YeaQ/YmgE (transglycosylase-associated protein family)
VLHILYFLLIGLAAGWLASKIMGDTGYGLAGNLAVGVLGAVIGGALFGGIFITGGIVGGLLSATAGACILLYVIKLVKGRSG